MSTATLNAAPHLRDYCLARPRVDAPLEAEGRYGRMFDLPPLIADEARLHAIGAAGGFCDAGEDDEDADVEAGWPFFGQYIGHDLTADRSPLRRHADVDALGSMRSPRANLETLYAGGPIGSPFLYDRADTDKLIEHDGDVPRNEQGIALIGDPRNDVHVPVSQMQLAFIRAHNRLVDRLRADGAPDGAVFDEARRSLTWHYQWSIVNDFLPVLVGEPLVKDLLAGGARFYGSEAAAFIPVEFADAAYRYGHSQIRERYRLRADGPQLAFFPDLMGFGPIGDRAVDWSVMFDIPGHPAAQRAKPIDGRLPGALIRLPGAVAGGPEDDPYRSLATRDLQRGQALGLPSGESVARLMGAAPLDRSQLGLERSGWRSETPLWLYILLEAAQQQSGNRLGEVGGRIVGEVLIGVLRHDPESYLSMDPGWRPTLPGRAGTFKLRDLLVPAQGGGGLVA